MGKYDFNPFKQNNQQFHTLNDNQSSQQQNLFQIIYKKRNYFTLQITIIQIVYYVISLIYFLMYKKYKDEKEIQWNCVLYNMGAKYTLPVVQHLAIHRLILPIILHAGITHILFNLFTQISLMFVLENFYGTKKIIFLYLSAGITGNMLSCIQHVEQLGIGASSSLFGIIGLYLLYLKQIYHTLGSSRNKQIFTFIAFLVANFISTFQTGQNIDGSAHLGGFAAGILFGLSQYDTNQYDDLSVFQIKKEKFIRVISIVIFFTLVVSIGYYLFFEMEKIDVNDLDNIC